MRVCPICKGATVTSFLASYSCVHTRKAHSCIISTAHSAPPRKHIRQTGTKQPHLLSCVRFMHCVFPAKIFKCRTTVLSPMAAQLCSNKPITVASLEPSPRLHWPPRGPHASTVATRRRNARHTPALPEKHSALPPRTSCPRSLFRSPMQAGP